MGIFNCILIMNANAIKSAQLLRPTVFSEGLGALVVRTIAAGATITATCATPGFPNPWTLRRWCHERPDFARDVDTAQRVRASGLIDQAMGIADDDRADYVAVTRKDGRIEMVFNHEHVARSKLRVDTRKWVAGRLDRSSWGDSKQVDVNAKILTISLSDDELDRQLRQAADKLRQITLDTAGQVIDIATQVVDE